MDRPPRFIQVTAILLTVLITVMNVPSVAAVTGAQVSIIPKMKSAAKDGRLDGMQIEYWVGGGQPPPYYRSEQFRLLSQGEEVQMEFAVLRFHPKLIPNEVTEKYTLRGIAEDVRGIARMLLDLRVFEIHFPEENDPSIGGVISHEIAVAAGKVEMKRTYYRTMPLDLTPLEKLLQKMIAKTREKGLHSWHHQGHAIEDPFIKR